MKTGGVPRGTVRVVDAGGSVCHVAHRCVSGAAAGGVPRGALRPGGRPGPRPIADWHGNGSALGAQSRRPSGGPLLLRRRALALFDFRDELLNGLVHLGVADVLEADDALVVQHVGGRPAVDVPSAGDGAVGALVPPGAPGHVLLLERLPEV